MQKINGKNVRRLRLAQSLTLAQLAEISGVNQSTIHKIEAGKRPHPHLSTVKKLADHLGVQPDRASSGQRRQASCAPGVLPVEAESS